MLKLLLIYYNIEDSSQIKRKLIKEIGIVILY